MVFWVRTKWEQVRRLHVHDSLQDMSRKYDTPCPETAYQDKYDLLMGRGIQDPIPYQRILYDMLEEIEDKRRKGYIPYQKLKILHGW